MADRDTERVDEMEELRQGVVATEFFVRMRNRPRAEPITRDQEQRFQMVIEELIRRAKAVLKVNGY